MRARRAPAARLLVGLAAALERGGERLALAVQELASLPRRFARLLAPFARLLASIRRVSSPEAGAISSATAAPVIAPSTNATTTVPASAIVCLAILCRRVSSLIAMRHRRDRPYALRRC